MFQAGFFYNSTYLCITMPSKNQITFVRSLQRKKDRDLHGLFVAEGSKTVEELLSSSMEVVMVMGLREWAISRENPIPGGVEFLEVTEKELDRISGMKTPNQVVAVVKKPLLPEMPTKWPETPVILLDRIQDPGNLGTIMRTADWFGMHTLICSQDTADAFNPKVIQASMGSFMRTRVHYADLRKVLLATKGQIPSYGAILGGNPITQTQPECPCILVLGNESQGISPQVEALLDQKVSIPPSFDGGAESLNASVAGGIMMFWMHFRHPDKG